MYEAKGSNAISFTVARAGEQFSTTSLSLASTCIQSAIQRLR